MDLKSFDWQTFDSTPSAGNSQSQEKTPWNAEKSAKLAEFMKTWGEKMGQPNYQKGIAGGDVGPDNLYTLGENSKMDAIYTDTGQGNAKYRIVERYSNWDKYPDVHSYFFAITDTGEGIVFHSPTTNGGKMYLKPTDNKELQEEFNQLLHQMKKRNTVLFQFFQSVIKDWTFCLIFYFIRGMNKNIFSGFCE